MSGKSRARFRPSWTGKALIVSSRFTEEAHWKPSRRYDEWYSRAEVNSCCEEHSFGHAPIRDEYTSLTDYLSALDAWESVQTARDECSRCSEQKVWFETVWNSPEWWLA